MEWRKASGAASTSASNEASNNGGFGGYTEGMVVDGGLYVKVMTDEQMEVLRRQIAVYATICEDLVKLHKAVTAQQDSLAGMRLGSIYCDPMVMCGGVPKITARQRWTPTPMQLQILESIFERGNGTPSKQKIKEITSELLHHGHVSETNVYNWFQNRRARSKRKQTTIAAPVKSESEAEGDAGSSDEKKAKFEKTNSFQSPEVSSEMHSIEKTNSLNDNSKSCGSLAQLSFYEESLSNPSI